MADRVLHNSSGYPTPPFDFSTRSPWVRERVEEAKIDPAMVVDIVASTDAFGKGYIVSVEIGYYPHEERPTPRHLGRPRTVCGGAAGFGAPGCTCGEHPPRGLPSPHCPMHGSDRG